MNAIQITGVIAVILAIALVGYFTGRNVHTAGAFTSASGQASTLLVVGIALATMIGGGTTVGTAQTAFNYGLAGWWYTLGSAASFLILALLVSEKLRKSGHQTMIGMISDEFGTSAELIAAFILCVSTTISLAAQMVSCQAVFTSIFPSIGRIPGLIICLILILICVFFGGSLSAGHAGKLKVLLMTSVIILGGITVIRLNGLTAIDQTLDHQRYFTLFSRGVGYELGNGLSAALGMCFTQSTISAILSAKDHKTARKALLICAAIMPLIGLGGVLIGMYMKTAGPSIAASQAFSGFVLNTFPSLLGGIGIGTLFVTLILSSGGTALGCSTIFVKNCLKPFVDAETYQKKELIYLRTAMLIILVIATVTGSGLFGDSVLSFSFLSMSLRSVTLIIPFILAVWFTGKTDKRFVILAEILSPIAVIFFGLSKLINIDEFYLGLAVALVCGLLALWSGRQKAKG